MSANPIELVGGLANTSDVVKADLIAWAKARVPQVMESAAEINDNGLFEFDAAEAAYFLRADESDIGGILASLEEMGRVHERRVVKWGDRQFQSDTAAERQKRYRERRKEQGDGLHVTGSDVTRPSRDGVVTPQDTETEADTEITRPPVFVAAEGARDFDDLFEAFPRNPTSNRVKAEAAFSATKAEDRPSILAAARRFALWFAEDCAARKRTLDAGLKFAPHLATWIESEGWREAAALSVKSDPSTPTVPMVRIDRLTEPDVWAACERIRGKKAPTSDATWAFPLDIVVRARRELASPSSAEVH